MTAGVRDNSMPTKGSTRPRAALVQRFVPHYNLVFYKKLLARSAYDWEFIYGEHPGAGESGLASDAPKVLPSRLIECAEYRGAVWQKGVRRILREQRYDAVVFELGWQIVSNPFVIRAAHQAGSVVMPWTKGISESGEARPGWRRWLERRFIHHCDALIAYGKGTVDYFAAYGFPRDRMFVAQNTMDVTAIVADRVAAEKRGAELRAEFGLQGKLVIGYLGRLVPQKQVDWIITAFAAARAAGLEAELVIAGDGPERRALEEQARQTPVAGSIRFCGRIAEADMGGYFQLFDVFVSAFAAGLAILEAMAHGKISLITPEARPETELVVDGVTGVITKDYSIPALAEGMQRSAEYARAGNRMGSAAREAVVAGATMEKMVEAFDQAVTCALKKSK